VDQESDSESVSSSLAGATNSCTNEIHSCLLHDGRLNALAVEQHMARMVWSQWQQFPTSSSSSMSARVKESMLQASAVQVRIELHCFGCI
jgi:hypothetical protein